MMPQWSVSRRVGRQLERSVKIAPRNSQEPCSRLTQIGVLALPADPGRRGERLFHHRRGVDEDLERRRPRPRRASAPSAFSRFLITS